MLDAAGQPRSTLGLLRAVAAQEGVGALYRGVAPNALGGAAAWGAYFYGYEHVKQALRDFRGRPLNSADHMLAAFTAGRLVVR